MTPYKALWRMKLPGGPVAYREVTVIAEPIFGHVKCAGKLAVPVSELVGVESDGYAVITPGGKRFLSVASGAGR